MGHQFIPHKFKRQRQLRRDGTLRNIQLDRYFFIRKMLTFTQNKYFLTRRRQFLGKSSDIFFQQLTVQLSIGIIDIFFRRLKNIFRINIFDSLPLIHVHQQILSYGTKIRNQRFIGTHLIVYLPQPDKRTLYDFLRPITVSARYSHDKVV